MPELGVDGAGEAVLELPLEPDGIVGEGGGMRWECDVGGWVLL